MYRRFFNFVLTTTVVLEQASTENHLSAILSLGTYGIMVGGLTEFGNRALTLTL